MRDQIRDGLPESGVGLDAMLVDLCGQPLVELRHQRTTPRLVKRQALVRRQLLLARLRVMAIHFTQGLEHMTTLRGKARRHVHESAPRMGEAIPEDHLQRFRQIARQRVAHLNRRPEIGRPLRENASEVLARMTTASQKQGDPMSIACRDDARREDACPIRRDVVVGGNARRDPGRPVFSTVMLVSSLWRTSPSAA